MNTKQEHASTPAASWLEARKKAAVHRRKRERMVQEHAARLRKLIGVPRAIVASRPSDEYPAARCATLTRIWGQIAVVVWDGSAGREETWIAKDLAPSNGPPQ